MNNYYVFGCPALRLAWRDVADSEGDELLATVHGVEKDCRVKSV